MTAAKLLPTALVMEGGTWGRDGDMAQAEECLYRAARVTRTHGHPELADRVKALSDAVLSLQREVAEMEDRLLRSGAKR